MRSRVLGRLALGTGVALTALAAAPAAFAGLSNTPDSTWGFNGRVTAIASDGTNLYVGGSFTQAISPSGKVVTRNHVAALNESSGALLTGWDANANGDVDAIAVSGGTVYLGGSFTTVGSKGRSKLAAVTGAGSTGMGGSLTSWNPGANGLVRAMAIRSGTVYFGGAFSSAGGSTRHQLAAVSASTGALTSWKPVPGGSGGVKSLIVAPDGSKVIVGGGFTSMNGDTNRAGVTAVTTTTGANATWAYKSPFPCYPLVANSTTTYCGGAGGGGHLLAMNTSTGAKTWVEIADGDVVSVGLVGNLVAGGGHFNNIGPFNNKVPRQHLAAFPATSSGSAPQADVWNPKANSNYGVGVLLGVGNHLWAGGDFTKIGSATRNHLARFTYTP
jgi:hypothetical protein